MITLSQCFSALVVAGKGSRCNLLRKALQDELFFTDPNTGKTLVEIYKFGKQEHPELHKYLRQCVAEIVRFQIRDIDVFYFGKDIFNERNSHS